MRAVCTLSLLLLACRMFFEVHATHVFSQLGYFHPNYSPSNLALVHSFCDISVVNHQKAKNK